MFRNQKPRQKSSADISHDIRLIHWSGKIDPSWEPGNSVIKDKVPRMDVNGRMVFPFSLLERGLKQDHPDPARRSEGIDIPLPRPEKIIVIDDRMGNGSISPQWLKVDAYEEWEHFFMCYPSPHGPAIGCQARTWRGTPRWRLARWDISCSTSTASES